MYPECVCTVLYHLAFSMGDDPYSLDMNVGMEVSMLHGYGIGTYVRVRTYHGWERLIIYNLL